MENKSLQFTGEETTRHPALASEQGFALVSLIALVPLALALVISLSAGFYFLKRKSLAQAHCVQQAAVMQKELQGTLEQLLRLNPKAKALRAQRQAADAAVKAAAGSVNPYALAAAKAYWSAVVLQQLALRSKQQALLQRASQQRHSGHRQLRERLRSLDVRQVDSKKYYWRALAVEASPPASLTPDYRPLPFFEKWQQHRFRFQVDLRPPFAIPLGLGSLKQITECSVTLKGEENQWKVQIAAASALSKWSWF